MALLHHSNPSMSSNNYSYPANASRRSSESVRPLNTQASAYAVDAVSMTLTGFHYSSTTGGAGAVHFQVWGRGFEVPYGGIPSPPPSPTAGRIASPLLRKRSSSPRTVGDAAYHITEECERLFCETLKTVFLVERDTSLETSLGMDTRGPVGNGNVCGPNHIIPTTSNDTTGVPAIDAVSAKTVLRHRLPTPAPSPGARMLPAASGGLMRDYVEMWDYVGGTRFRGFVAERADGELAMFAFFDLEVMTRDLKPGLMTLMELASSSAFGCSQLVVCVDRNAPAADVKDTVRDLGWVGFELMLLDSWANGGLHGPACTSDRWLFLGMDL